jgi:uncharacterized protein involved in exopolysaccharide biosynthesis
VNPTHPLPFPPPRLELDLGDYIAAVWQRRHVIVGLGLLLAVVAGVASALVRPRYQATLLVRVSPSKLTDGTVINAGTFGPASLVPLMRGSEVVQAALAANRLDAPPHSLTATRFVDSYLKVSRLEDTDYVEMRVTFTDPAIAVRMANAIGQHAFAAVRAVTNSEVADLERQLKPVVEEAEQRFKSAETNLDTFRQAAQVELIKKDVDTLLLQRGELAKLQVDIDAERARLARAEHERGDRKEFDKLSQTLVDNPVLSEAARSQIDTRTLLGLSLSSEQVNDVYKKLDEAVATSRTELASLESQRDRLVKTSGLAADTLPRLREYYLRETREKRLLLEYDIAKKAFQDISERYQGARLATLSRTPLLLVVDEADLPEQPISRNVVRNTAIGLVLGIALGVLYAFAKLALPRLAQDTGRTTVS